MRALWICEYIGLSHERHIKLLIAQIHNQGKNGNNYKIITSRKGLELGWLSSNFLGTDNSHDMCIEENTEK